MIRIGLLAFPDMTQLDMTGPLQVFAALPDAETRVIWKTREPLSVHGGLTLMADTVMAGCPALDVIVVPGGSGVGALMLDPETLGFLRAQAAGARFVGSVCTGALVLGAAGLLHGRRATTHWAAVDLLPRFGAIPTPGRVVRDGNLFTGGGVTAGIDFALTIAAELAGQDIAEAIQLQIEYAPAPPFQAGTPDTAPPAAIAHAMQRLGPMRAGREAIVAEAVANLTRSSAA